MPQTKDDKISGPPLRKLFEGKKFVYVSTLMKIAIPQITPWKNKMAAIFLLTLQWI
jgi:hypothetical protein